METNKIEDMPPFIFDVYDKDTIEDDFICRCKIPVMSASYSKGDGIPEPRWHECRLKPKSPPCGEILVCFSIVESDYNYIQSLNYVRLRETVELQEF